MVISEVPSEARNLDRVLAKPDMLLLGASESNERVIRRQCILKF